MLSKQLYCVNIFLHSITLVHFSQAQNKPKPHSAMVLLPGDNSVIFRFFLIQRMSTVVMQSLAYIQHSSPVPGAQLFVAGDLRLQQRVPLPHRGLYNVYNVSSTLPPLFKWSFLVMH